MYCKTRYSESQAIRERLRKAGWSYVEYREEDPVEKHDGDSNVGLSPPRGGKRGALEGNDLAPVKGENTHGQTMGNAKQLVNLGIVGSYPANPREARESGE